MLLFLVIRGLAVAVAAPECASLDAGLRCSACSHFVEAFYAASTRLVFRAKKTTSVARVYKERLKAIYEEYAPEKLESVDKLLARAKGQEHHLYARVCAKYGVFEEEPYDGRPSPQEEVAKAELVEAALEATVEDVRSQQWAEADDFGKKAFVDFQKAMSGGSITGSISMGPEVTEKMAACYQNWATDHKDTLIARMAAVARPYDTKLHKTFCENARACNSDPDDFFEL